MVEAVRRSVGWLLVLGCAGCAQVGSPDGGGRDEVPPMVVESDPPFGQTLFDRTAFTLTFDEFVQLQDARRQILVSPPLPAPPRAMVRGRSVMVDLGDSLLADRTYIVQFGESIRDLRESNVAGGLTYVFSTGMALDSARVMGRVEDAWTGEPGAGARVLLYSGALPEGVLDPDLPDSIRPLPDYVGLVDDSGRFDVGFLPMGALGIAVVDDANGNYRIDHGEASGWWDQPMDADSDSMVWQALSGIPPARMDAPPAVPSTYLSGIRVDSSGYFRAAIAGLGALREGVDGLRDADFGLEVKGAEGSIPFGFEGDSIWSVLPGFPDAMEGPWVVGHPSGSDTLAFRGMETAHPPVVVRPPERLADKDGGVDLRLAPMPTGLDTALCSVLVILDGDTAVLGGGHFELQESRLLVHSLPAGANARISMLPGALMGHGGPSLDTMEWRVTVRRPEDFGAIRLVLDSASAVDSENWVWLLLNGSGNPMDGFILDEAGRFSFLPPGKYGVARIEDLDGNGRWSGADPSRGIHPESVERWASDVDVRSGWEVELSIGVHPRP